METGTNKDWMDAVREQCFSDGAAPSPDGWSQIGGKMRRAAARRRAILAAGIILPMAALLLWAPWRKEELPTSQPVAQSFPAGIPDPSPVLPDPSLVILSESEGSPIPRTTPSTNLPFFEDEEANPSDISSNAATNEDGSPWEEIPGQDHPRNQRFPGPPVVGDDEQQIREAPRKEERLRIAVGLRAGAGTFRRTADIAWQSAPYIAALTYLNVAGPANPGVKSNTSNTLPFVPVANVLYPDAVSHYTHDLPLTVGLSVRMELGLRTGLESGLEYTYLHSIQESVAGRLDQRLHFIGIPLRADVRILSAGGFDLYAGLGARMEKCVSATLGRISCEEPRLQWSAEAFAGIQYRLGGHVHLYFQPELSYYFTRTDLVTYRTEHPLGLTLHAGLRFDL